MCDYHNLRYFKDICASGHSHFNVVYCHRWSEIIPQILQTSVAPDCSLIKAAIWTAIVLLFGPRSRLTLRFPSRLFPRSAIRPDLLPRMLELVSV